MKLERLFEVKDSKLYKIGESEVFNPKIRNINWSDVESEPEIYNEDFLAKLRDELKELENNNEFVVIVPSFDKNADSEQFTQAMKHTARRIKDCVSVIGFSIPKELDSQEKRDYYMEEMSAKHKQYCFFSSEKISETIANL